VSGLWGLYDWWVWPEPNGEHFALSKVFFVDTLRCAFEGRSDLFLDQHQEKNWDFEKTYPVLSMRFAGGRFYDLK